ncbi:MAG: hypothetical protein LYZ70_07605 [Nitrososphaerales archaeon]|nr:hypothetical protein [Nitrososphaerales archaeon]
MDHRERMTAIFESITAVKLAEPINAPMIPNTTLGKVKIFAQFKPGMPGYPVV